MYYNEVDYIVGRQSCRSECNSNTCNGLLFTNRQIIQQIIQIIILVTLPFGSAMFPRSPKHPTPSLRVRKPSSICSRNDESEICYFRLYPIEYS